MTATGTPATVDLVSPTEFARLGGLASLWPPAYGTQNIAGTAQASTLSINISGLPIVRAPFLTGNTHLVLNGEAARWHEDRAVPDQRGGRREARPERRHLGHGHRRDDGAEGHRQVDADLGRAATRAVRLAGAARRDDTGSVPGPGRPGAGDPPSDYVDAVCFGATADSWFQPTVPARVTTATLIAAARFARDPEGPWGTVGGIGEVPMYAKGQVPDADKLLLGLRRSFGLA